MADGPLVRLASDVLVADIDLRVEPGKINVDPVRIFRRLIEKSAVLHHLGIHRILEGIRIARLIKGPILMLRQIYPKIPPSFRIIIAVTGSEAGDCHATNSQGGQKLYCLQFKDSFLR